MSNLLPNLPPGAAKVLVGFVVVAFTIGSLYSLVTGGDYRVTIGLAAAVLMTIGVDISAVTGVFQGGGAGPSAPPPAAPPPPKPDELAP